MTKVKAETQEQQNGNTSDETIETVTVTFNTNVKHNDNRYKKGESAEVAADERIALEKAGVIVSEKE